MKRFTGFIVAGLLVLAAAGCAPGADSNPDGGDTTKADGGDTTQTSDQQLVFGLEGDPGSQINVITTNDRMGLNSIKALYSPLYMFNADGINYFLAESHQVSEDGKTITVKLRDGVTWHDGEAFSADDVVFTYESMLATPDGWATGQLTLNGTAVKVTKVDDTTVDFVFPEVTAAAEELISAVFIMPKHIYDGVKNFSDNEFNAKAIGTGPYKMVEYKKGQYTKLEANADYFLGAPKIKTIILQFISDPNSAKLALQKGEINMMIVQPADVEEVTKDGAVEVHPYSEGRIGWFGFNANNMKDQKIRQALLYALDKDKMNLAAYGDDQYYTTTHTFLPPENPFSTQDVEQYSYDPEKAKQLLAEAGAKDLKLKIAYFNIFEQVNSRTAAIMQENWKAVGVEMESVSAEVNALVKEMNDPESTVYDGYFSGYIMGIDPSTFGDLFKSDAPSNSTHMNLPEVDDLFNKAAVELDPDKRKEMYTEVQKKIAESGYFYPHVNNKRILAVSSTVKGVDDAKLVPVYTFEDMSKLYFEE